MNKTILTLLVVLLSSSMAYASGDSVKPPKQDWTFSGMTGTYDKAALQRGYKVYKEVCSACHSMKRIYFRNLEALGYDENQIKNIAADYTVIDGPDSEGEMFERTARPSDAFPSPYPNKQAAKAANGTYPPDLSLITKARAGGADYVYGILTGFEDASHHGANLSEGQYWNKYMPGHVIAMAPPLSDDQVAYEDDTPATLDQYAKDVAHFLTWAAEPEMEDRKRIGIQVLLYLLALAGVMYALKKRIWKDVH